jgi:hypothetical protein
MATTVVSPTPSRILTLRQIIRIAAKGYEGSVRSWDHFLDDKGRMRKDADAGDTLVTFIIREFGDIHDEAASADDQLVVASRCRRRGYWEPRTGAGGARGRR